MNDGTITIRTKVDTTGINKGTQVIEKNLSGLKKSVLNLSKAMLLAFSFNVLVRFAKDSIKANTDLENSMKGLRSIVEGQGRDFEKANKFIQSYISDGLIPATQAVTAYKNLAMRGYTDTQIETTLQALKDSATYGRQASLTLGQAVSSATEGLKNENSILVDNAGVTKNVSKMWEDYAKSIGVGAKSLTKTQKIQAEVNGILEETRFQTGNAKEIADSYSGVMLKLSFVFNDLKIAIGGFIKPLVKAFVPVLTFLIRQLTIFFNLLAKFTSSVFGVSTSQAEKQADSIANSVESEKELGKETDKTNKKAKNQLASFDEIEKLSAETADNMGGMGGSVDMEMREITGDDENITDIVPVNQFVEDVKKVFSELGKWFNTNFTPLFKEIWKNAQPNIEEFKSRLSDMFSNFETLKEPLIRFFTTDFTNLLKQFVKTSGAVVNGLFDTFNMVFFDIVNKVVIPYLDGLLSVILPLVAQVLTELLNTFGVAFEQVKLIFDKLWKEAIAPSLDMIMKIWREAWEVVKSVWDKYGKTIFDNINKVIKTMGDVIVRTLDSIVIPIWENFMEVIGDLWDKALKPLLTNVAKFVSDLAIFALEIFNNFILPIVDWLVDVLGPQFASAFNHVINTLKNFITFVTNMANGVIIVFRGIVEFLSGVFTGDWEKAWQGILTIFDGLWNLMVGIFKYPINVMIDMLNGFVQAVVDGVNVVIRALNRIQFTMPDWLGGETFGINIPLMTAPKIPRLAKGAVIPPNKEFMAVLGDQKSGVNIETPLETMIEAFKTANADSGGGRDLTVVLEISGREFGRLVYKMNKEERQRVGVNLALGGGF